MTGNKIRNLTIDEFYVFTEEQLDGISDFELLILKGHILVEYTLNCYLEAISKDKDSDFFKENLSFSIKVKIAKHFGQLGSVDDNLIKELTILNKLRNDIAHSLSYKKEHLTELFSELSKKSPSGLISDSKNSQQERFIGVISFITGAIFTAYKYYTNPEELKDFI
ncbi:hypothetical protein [Winogradskyella sediminis]|uniref:hypothetical protein n=1 Tax=Winogradskyella sediminis TaxID=1382466 RepID=UPI000E27C5E7|nr:hypothetical protein [Winogradskyella sediminis]REG83351.1 hypothetical protein C8N41_1142 [Winogradskyella sediminis]